MRAVIPIGPRRPLTLPHVLRSLVAHANVDELITVGEPPKGIEPDFHIDSPNTDRPHVNILGHLRRATEHIDGKWVWCDDDMFLLKPWTPGVYVRGYSIASMLRKYPNRGTWSQAVRASIKVMEGWGYDPEEVPCGTIHRPWLVDSDRVRMVCDALGNGSFKALYVAGLDDVIPAPDPKVTGRGVPKPDADVISVLHDSWRHNAGRLVRETFTEPTRWETEPTAGKALAGSGHEARRHRRRR